MLELVPEQIDGAVICNVIENPNRPRLGKDHSVDVALALYNWIKRHEMRYVILDLQDEKDVCEVFLAELMQLKKRLPIPCLFIGVMDRPLKFLCDYDYTKDFPDFHDTRGCCEGSESAVPRCHRKGVKPDGVW